MTLVVNWQAALNKMTGVVVDGSGPSVAPASPQT
jgi:hypothetical protein